VVRSTLRVSGRQVSMLFEPVNQAFDPTALTIARTIKGPCPALVLAPWHGEPDALCPQVVLDFSTAVPLVAGNAAETKLGAATLGNGHL